jgi:hypothetical protein
MSHRMRLFSGSLHESIGPLSSFTKDGMVYALVDPMHQRFLVAEPLKPNKKCESRVQVLMSQKKKVAKTSHSKLQFRHGLVCNGVNRWISK